MSKKMMMLALAAVSAVLFALPAVASAETVHAEKAVGGGSPGVFTGSTAVGSELRDSEGTRLHSTLAGTVAGEFETTTTGWIEITFKGVTGPFGFPCNSTAPAEPSGTVKTTKLPFHLVRDAAATNTPYVLVTPAADGVFAHLACAGLQRTVHGTGLIGTLTAPKCGESSTSATVRFERSATVGVQKHTTVTGVKYTFTSSVGGAATMDAVGTLNFLQSTKLNCT